MNNPVVEHLFEKPELARRLAMQISEMPFSRILAITLTPWMIHSPQKAVIGILYDKGVAFDVEIPYDTLVNLIKGNETFQLYAPFVQDF